jgi:hypothetical protein
MPCRGSCDFLSPHPTDGRSFSTWDGKIRPRRVRRYDIPVLHVNGMYWTKHRLSVEDAIAGLGEASEGRFVARKGEPDAGRLERG